MNHSDESDDVPSVGDDFIALVGALVRERHELSNEPATRDATKRGRRMPLRADRHRLRDRRSDSSSS
jgi:hypothetical protein